MWMRVTLPQNNTINRTTTDDIHLLLNGPHYPARSIDDLLCKNKK